MRNLLAYTRKLFSDLLWNNARAADRCPGGKHSCMLFRYRADNGCVAPMLMFLHLDQHALCYKRIDDRNELSFIGHIDRVHAEQVARGLNIGQHRQAALVEDNANPRLRRDIIERAGQAAARRITQDVQVRRERQQRCNEAIQRRG